MKEKVREHQLKYRHYINFVITKMEGMNVRILTPIFIYVYPYVGWRAVFGGSDGEEDHFYILDYEGDADEFKLEVQRNNGFHKNGTLVLK